MPFIPTASCCRVIVKMAIGQQDLNWVLHFKKASGSFSETDRENLADALTVWLDTEVAPLLSSDWFALGLSLVNQESANAPSTEGVFSPVITGDVSETSVPTGTANVVTHRTDLRGRSYRGRSYVPGVPNSVGSAEGPGSTFATNIADAFAFLMDTLNTAGFIWSVLSLFTGGAPRASGILTPITSVTNDGAFDSQRRRLPGRGI